jgi:anaerobic carbon-monoxide dehydrogenase iron sulfur subunit
VVHYIDVNPDGCTGCRECEMVCSLHHFGECNPELAAVRVVRNEGQGLAEPVPLVCQQCDEPACAEACPQDAVSKADDSGVIHIDPDICTGCGECTSACPAGCIFLNADETTAIACDLCDGDPQCVPMCHSASLRLLRAESENNAARVNRLAGLLSLSLEASRGHGLP